MKKIIAIFILIINLSPIQADEFVWGEEFKDGDTISAEVFNQIFDTIEKINRTVVDEDLIGTWSCDAITTRSTTNWVDKGSFYLLEDAQLNFNSTSDNSSIENPYSITSSSPSVLKRTNSAFTGTYQLYKNMLFIKENGDSNSRIYSVDIVSNTRIELTFLETSATSFPANYSSFIVCDTTVSLPSPPSNMSITTSESSITIGWEDNSNDETGFRIYRKKAGDESYSLFTTVDQNIVSYTDNDVSEGLRYFYYVTSFNENGESSKSNPVDATFDTIKPTVVSTIPADGGSASDLTVTITFSEPITITCIDGSVNIRCSDGPAVLLVGANNTYGMGQIGFSGITLSAEPFVDGANPSYTVTIKSDLIYDNNGNKMAEDYVFTFSDD